MEGTDQLISRRKVIKLGALAGVATVAAACNASAPPAQPSGAAGAGASAPASGAAAAAPTQALEVKVAASSRLGQILKAGKLVVGCTASSKPTSYRDESGNLVGFYIDVHNQMASDLGVKIEYADQEWAGLIPGVLAGKLDLASAGLTNTPARATSMFFSNPYIPFAQTLVVSKMGKRKSYSDYNSADARLVALQGSTESQTLQRLFPKANYVGLPDNNAVLLEVAAGRAAGAVVTTGTAAPFLKTNTNFDYFDPTAPLSFEYGALAMTYGDWEFKNWVDEWLRYWNAKGFIQATYQKWYEGILGSEALKGLQIPRY